ncbi:MBL fold metallo-hydrolase [Cesiribacter andamanensis]|uniref:Ribonuclease n=1 Tax=Cesiribacter andamanensis AMV16 TaxID=1279009 RepID=M7N1N8_9BACT|nr:MBL fold metallo-hydrolase [Cesiribacter andamanensis]EMR02603.1 Ribonuclease [Cesiribacter andamanensis AMV16]
MVLSFYGAAQTVTGSKHLLSLESGKRILLDCGMFQGMGEKVKDLNHNFGFEAESIDYVILSHAHIDHSGLLPRLVKLGFGGNIYCTPPTRELCELLLMDSAGLQSNENDADIGKEALYDKEDVGRCLERFVTLAYNEAYPIDDEVELLFTDAGHILGSACVNLRIREGEDTLRLCFTGDVGRYENRILRAPQPLPQADVLICESTYASKVHAKLENTEERLRDIVLNTCVEKGGKLFIPAFSIGRTQELVYSLNILAEEGRLPEDLLVFVDSPLSVYATDIMRSHPEYFNEAMLDYIRTDPDPFGFPQLHFITETEDSKLINAMEGPCVIISASGMMEGGRIRHHLKKGLSDARNTILITGYCEPSTLGGRLLKGAPKVSLFDQELEVKAEVVLMNEYSAHGDYSDIMRLLLSQNKEEIRHLFLVHGVKENMLKFKEDLEAAGYSGIELPDFRLSYEIKGQAVAGTGRAKA